MHDELGQSPERLQAMDCRAHCLQPLRRVVQPVVPMDAHTLSGRPTYESEKTVEGRAREGCREGGRDQYAHLTDLPGCPIPPQFPLTHSIISLRIHTHGAQVLRTHRHTGASIYLGVHLEGSSGSFSGSVSSSGFSRSKSRSLNTRLRLMMERSSMFCICRSASFSSHCE